MKSRILLVAVLFLAACEPPPMIDPCAEGYQKLQSGDSDGAIAAFAKAMTSDAAHRPAIEQSLGACVAKKAAALASKGQTQEALTALREAQTAGPEALKHARNQLVPLVIPAVHAAAAKEPGKAVELLKWLISVAKDEAVPHAAAVAARVTAHGWQCAQENQIETAVGSFAAAAALHEENTLERDDLAVLSELFRARLAMARSPKDASDTVARTMSRRKTEGTAAFARALMKEAVDALIDEQMKKEEHRGAVGQVDEALKLMPEFSPWWYTRKMRALVAESDALFALGKLEAALPPLQEACNLPQVDAKPLVNAKIRQIEFRLGTAAMRAQDWGAAIAHFMTVTGLDEHDPLPFELRAQCYENKQLWRQAAGDYEILAQLLPERSDELKEKAKVTRAKFKPSDGGGGPRD